MKISIVAVFLAAFASSVHAEGSVGTVFFDGTIGEEAGSCSIMVNNSGYLESGHSPNILTSKYRLPGQAQVATSNDMFQIHVTSPNSFIKAPPELRDPVEFPAYYSGSGATTFGEKVDKVPTRLRSGVTAIKVDLEAEKASGPFPPGDYRAAVILTCEIRDAGY